MSIIKKIIISSILIGNFSFGASESIAKLVSEYAAEKSEKQQEPIKKIEPESANNMLSLAAKTNNVPLAKKALELGADINIDIQTGGNQTPIFWAIQYNSKEVAKVLLKNGAMPTLGKLIRYYLETASKQIIIKKALKFIDEMLEESLLPEYYGQVKENISTESNLPMDLAAIITGYTYSPLPKEDLEELKKLKQEIQDKLEKKA